MTNDLLIDMNAILLASGGAIDQLSTIDADVADVIKQYGPPPDRSLPANFDTLARAIVGQQISRAAATSIWNRMEANGVSEADVIATKSPDDLAGLGLSRRKAEYIIGIADEIVSKRIDLHELATWDGQAVQDRLVQIRGIGAWTADNFRLFALGDMDAWPVNDIALQEGMKRLKKLSHRPKASEMEMLGEAWRPYRGAGALVLWHLYGIVVRKATISDI
ncbi:DNA-3-methyladenine glycosylase family protein [Candidatus Puniceispirillum sp.]|uniref:DNA-3-methyladenine glycosylase family protein n=1 Tax=Candidatus Puniceispirillum sp. TaxID=2026719 RepID=UPI003F6A04EE